MYARVRQYFNEQELVNLTMAVVTINGWNRLAIGFRWPVWGISTKALERHIAGSGAVDMAACRLFLADPFSKEYPF